MEENFNLDLEERTYETPVEQLEGYKAPKKQSKRSQKTEQNVSELKNCLRNERVIVRFIKKPSPIIGNNPDHVGAGGLVEGCGRTYCLPQLTSGSLKNCLTNDEKDFLEYILGFEPNALSVYNKTNNYWKSGSGNAEIKLDKEDRYLDLSDPHEYIIYKMLLANTDTICPSLQMLRDNRKASYEYVIINENDEAMQADQEMSVTSKCYLEVGKWNDNKDVLQCVIELLEGHDLDDNTKIEFLRQKANEKIKMDPKMFLGIISDDHIKTKALIRKAAKSGIISRRGNYYYLTETNEALCNTGEDPDLTTAAKFLDNPKRQDMLFRIQAKLNQ